MASLSTWLSQQEDRLVVGVKDITMRRSLLTALIISALAQAQPYRLVLDSVWSRHFRGHYCASPKAAGDSWILVPAWYLDSCLFALGSAATDPDAFHHDDTTDIHHTIYANEVRGRQGIFGYNQTISAASLASFGLKPGAFAKFSVSADSDSVYLDITGDISAKRVKGTQVYLGDTTETESLAVSHHTVAAMISGGIVGQESVKYSDTSGVSKKTIGATAWAPGKLLAGTGISLTPSGDSTTVASTVLANDSSTVTASLQGKDTTALWNAKTSQGKDTTGLKSLKSLPQSCDTASSATPTPNCDATDIYCLTAQAAAAAFAAPAGTPVNGQKLIIRIHDDGIARALTWNAAYRSRGATLLTTTTPGVTNYIGLIWNATESVWDCEAAN